MSTTIRVAQPSDAFVVAALAVRAGRELGNAPDRSLLSRWADTWLASFAQRPTWVAEHEGLPVGVITAHVASTLPGLGDERERGAEATQVWLYVVPERRRGGVGARLLQAALARAATDGVRVVADLDGLGAARPGMARRVERSGVPVRSLSSPSGARRPVPAGTPG